MRVVLAVSILVTINLTGAEAMRVDGVRVYGKVHSVSVADIREAMTTGIGAGRKASEVEVSSSKEMRVYLTPRDLGWIPVSRGEVTEVSGRKHLEWSGTVIGIHEPEVLAVINGATEVYIFPVAKPLNPRRDDNHLRLLDAEARQKLIRLLGDKRTWWQGGWSLVVFDDGSRGVGLLFRRGKDEVVIFESKISDEEGTFNGRHIIGLLDDKRGAKRMEKWLQQFAQPELSPNRPNQALQPTALLRCAFVPILISVPSTVAQPRSQSGG